MKAADGVVVPYQWQYGYITCDFVGKQCELKPPEYRRNVYFFMHSTNNLTYKRIASIAPQYDVACDAIETTPVDKIKRIFIWNDILFSTHTRIEHKGDNQIKWKKEWQRLCPIAVEAISSQLEIFELEPETTEGKQP